MPRKTALITGVTGQDGSYLTDFLLKKGYKIIGVKRRSSSFNTQRIDHIYNDIKQSKNFIPYYGDLTDSSNILRIIQSTKPDEIYNLGAQSHVHTSFEIPEYSANADALGTLRILEALRVLKLQKKTKFYQASTSEMFGNINSKKISESDRFEPLSPYASSKLYSYWVTRNYRDSYNIFASNGILFNHESPLRGETFVSRKVTMNVAKRFLGKKDILYLGNIYSKRDWGHAKDYVEAMWKILQCKKADDFVVATNNTYTVKQLVNEAFKNIKVKIKWVGKGINEKGINAKTKEVLVKLDKRYFRPNELNYLRGNYNKARKILKWKPKTSFKQLVKEMVHEDIKNLNNGN